MIGLAVYLKSFADMPMASFDSHVDVEPILRRRAMSCHFSDDFDAMPLAVKAVCALSMYLPSRAAFRRRGLKRVALHTRLTLMDTPRLISRQFRHAMPFDAAAIGRLFAQADDDGQGK